MATSTKWQGQLEQSKMDDKLELAVTANRGKASNFPGLWTAST